MTHFFLATFTEGWVVLVLLGLLYDRLKINKDRVPLPPSLLAGLILFGAPLTFPYGISEGLLSPQLLLTARGGGLLAVTGLGLNLYVLVQKTDSRLSWYWKVILSLLGFKALGQLAASVLPAAFWISDHGLRILYLHLLLLGAFTLGAITFLHRRSDVPDIYLGSVIISVLAVLFSLLLPTHFWPVAWGGIWPFYVLATAALLPVLAVFIYGIKFQMQELSFNGNEYTADKKKIITKKTADEIALPFNYDRDER